MGLLDMSPEVMAALGSGLMGRGNFGERIQSGLLGARQVGQYQKDIEAKKAALKRQEDIDAMNADNIYSQINARNHTMNNPKSGTYANQPFYARDADGNIKAYQLNNKGQPREIDLPKGFNPAIPMNYLDTGAGYLGVGKYGQLPSDNNANGQPVTKPVIPKTIPPEKTVEHLGKVADATTERKAKVDLDKANLTADKMIANIDSIISHPDRDFASGFSNYAFDIAKHIPGTASSGLDKRLKQVKGEAFLAAFESLKGAGQITELEGQEAKNAFARLDEAQSDEDYLTALQDAKKSLIDLKALAAKKARAVETVDWNDL